MPVAPVLAGLPVAPLPAGGFVPEATCPSNAVELQRCVLRFLCLSPTCTAFPLSPVALNADLRRAYQRAGHSKGALAIFRASSTGEAIRSIAADLKAAGWAAAIKLEDAASSDDILVLDADVRRIHSVLLSNGTSSNGPTSNGSAAGHPSQLSSGAQPSTNGISSETSCSRQAPAQTARRERIRASLPDDDDELSRLLAEPTVKRREWEAPKPKEDTSIAPAPKEAEPSDIKAPASTAEVNSFLDCDTLVFTPDMDDAAIPGIDKVLSDIARERRSLSSVANYEWISASSLTDLDEIFPDRRPPYISEREKAEKRAERAARYGPRTVAPLKDPSQFRERSRSRKRDERPEMFSADAWEEHRSKRGLQLLGQNTSLPWSYKLLDESRRSFVGFLQNPFGEEVCKQFFERIRDGCEWKQPEGINGLLPRKTAWMVSKGCTCTYRYGGIEVPPQEFTPWMSDLLHVAMPYCGLPQHVEWPNSCNVNLYEDGGMSVGWHADDERLFQGRYEDCRIISLSLGVTRKFELRHNWPQEGEMGVWRVHLGNGDLLTMEGMTQKHFQHRVPREDYVQEPRINLTWRWVTKHMARCPVQRPRRRR